MIDFEVNSADYWESRFEGDWAQTQGCEQTRYFARILLDNLPSWLEDEIKANNLSICDWGCAEGEAVDSFRTHFPQSRITGIDRSGNAIRKARGKFGTEYFIRQDVLTTPLPITFDVLAISNVLQYFKAPWLVLRTLGAYASRHLLVLVPFREEERIPGHLYNFDDATIGTLIDPDFILSSCKIVDRQILLVYSRSRYFPHVQATFKNAGEIDREILEAPAAEVSLPRATLETGDGIARPIETIILPALRRAESIVVVPCAIPFSSALNQRPVHCAKYFADHGVTVLFVEVWECPEQAIHKAGEEVYPGVFSIPFYAFRHDIVNTFQDNIDDIAWASNKHRTFLCTLPTRELVDTARLLRVAGYHIHYDILDDWEEFYRGDEEMTHWFSASVELEMVALADTVTAVSRKLVQKFERLRPDIAVVRNGYQPSALACEQFAAARKPLERPKVVGYFGHLSDAWFDWETVFYAAQKCPDLEFELIGYGLSERSSSRLNGFPNIRFVGLVPQKDLQNYVRKWWAGMIPFQPSALSDAVDPLKVYEYLHFGLPTVVTGIPGIADYPLVQFAGDRDSFVAALDQLPDRPDEQSLSEVDEFLKTCTWEERLGKLNSLISNRDGGAGTLAEREAALQSDAQYWRAKAAELGKQLKQQVRIEHQLREDWKAALERQAIREAALSSDVQHWQSQAAGLATQVEQQVQLRTAELERQAMREAALQSDVQHWQSQAAGLATQLEQQGRRLEEEVAQFRALEANYAAENRTVTSRAAASAQEAADLRRLVSDLLCSRSWKITAPLRFLSKPLFTAPAAGPPEPSLQSTSTDLPESVLAELRSAQSIVVIPCAVPFLSAVNQRPISCAKYLADRGSTVLYVAWQSSPGGEIPQTGQQVYPRVFHVPLSVFEANIDKLVSVAHAKSSYLCTLPSPGLVEAARSLRAGGYHIHYDIMDDWEEFHRDGEAPWYSASVEREMVALADTVTAVSEKLAGKFAHLRQGIIVMRNGYDPSALDCRQFIAAHTPLEPPKTIGYFGHLSHAWFDWETVMDAAQKLPDVQFELIGYGLPDRLRARIGDFANIRFAGLVSQNDLHRYARKWWAGMIPFRPSALSAAVDPLKIYEYLHFGLPTIVTGISGIADFPLVRYAENRESFVSAIDKVKDRPGEQSLSEVDEFLKACVWEQRLAQLNSLIAQPAGLASLYAQ